MNKRLLKALSFALVSVFVAIGPVVAGPPPNPFSPYGTAKISGADVPDGTIVGAWCGGVQYEQTATATQNGESWYYNLDVPGDDPDTLDIKEGCYLNETVGFKIGNYWADQTEAWVSGAPQINLTTPTAYTSTQSVGAGDPSPINFPNTGITLDFSVSPGGNVTVTMHASDYSSPPDGVLFMSRYWDISADFSSGFTADLVFNYWDNDLNGASESDVAGAARWDAANARWEYMAGTVDTGANTVTLTGVTQFSRWALLASSPPQAPTGLTIAKSGNDVLLTWTPVTQDIKGNPLSSVSYRVYRKANDPYFTPTAGDLIGSPSSASYTDTGAVGDTANNYYYVVRAADTDGHLSAISSRVGKFVISVLSGWNQPAWPLLPPDTTLDGVLGTQLHGSDSPLTADRVLVWSGSSQSYASAWFCGGPICESWGEPWANHWLADDYSPSTLTLLPDSGFWVQNRSGATEFLTVVGPLAEADRSVAVGQNWWMLGSAFPDERPLDSAHLPATGTDSPLTADRVLYWNAATQAYKSAWYCGGPICEGWGEPWANHWLADDYSQTDIVIQAGHGFWYQNRHNSFTWINPTPEN